MVQLLDKAMLQGIAGRLVNTRNRSGLGPLHYAAWGGLAHIVRKLLMATSVADQLLLQGCTDSYDRCAQRRCKVQGQDATQHAPAEAQQASCCMR